MVLFVLWEFELMLFSMYVKDYIVNVYVGVFLLGYVIK